MTRTKILFIRVSEEEKNKAKQAADAEGLTMSAYLRRCFLLAPPTQPTKRAA